MEQPSPSGDSPRIVPRRPRTNPNISSTPPLKEFAVVGLVVAVLLLSLYWALGFAVGWAAVRIPDPVEARWGDLLASTMIPPSSARWEPTEHELQELVDAMGASLPPRNFPYRVHVIDADVVNAVALPGGHIAVYAGLLREVASENELAMILGHELGHMTHRHHLRAMGRRLVLAFLVQAVLGGDAAARMVAGGLEIADHKFSRDQELQADALGLDLLVSVYGHAGGAVDFFARHAGEGPQALALLSTHPLSERRIERLEALRRQRGYPLEDTVPWEIPQPR
jgi:predicted Zn-dependent protease